MSENPIDRVLQAERQADKAIADCRRRAERVLEAAREQARRVAQRADQRITAVHARCVEATESRIEALREQMPAEDPGAVDPDRERRCLHLTVSRLAARLTGEDDERQR